MEFQVTPEELKAVLPATILFVTGLVLMLVDPLLQRGSGPAHGRDESAREVKSHLGWISCGGGLLALAAIGMSDPTGRLFSGAISVDAFGEFASAVIIVAAILTCLASGGYLGAQGYNLGEFYALVFLGAGSMVLLAEATNLLVIFVAIETLSLSVYVLAGYFRNRSLGTEGAFKYFVMGAFASGFLLFGLALLYGATGSLELSALRGAQVDSTLLSAGLLFAVVGFAFKVGAVPFHSWVPDAYQGAPLMAAGWMAVSVKVASFASLIRVLVAISPTGASSALANMIAALAVVTMIMGNLAALNQTNLKRMLAYSGIAHTGYLLIPAFLTLSGVVPVGVNGDAQHPAAGALFYFAAYAFMTLGAFTAIAVVSRGNADLEEVDGLNGLSRQHPLVALALTISLISLAGIPLTGGFVGKLWIFGDAVRTDFLYLAVLGVFASIVSVYYYLRPVVAMWFREEDDPITRVETPWGLHFTLFVTTAGTLILGIYPRFIEKLSLDSIRSLTG